MSHTYMKLERNPDKNGNVNFIVNVSRRNYIKLEGFNEMNTILSIRNFLTHYGVWNTSDKIVDSLKPVSYIPPIEFHDISFMITFYIMGKIAYDKHIKEQNSELTKEHITSSSNASRKPVEKTAEKSVKKPAEKPKTGVIPTKVLANPNIKNHSPVIEEDDTSDIIAIDSDKSGKLSDLLESLKEDDSDIELSESEEESEPEELPESEDEEESEEEQIELPDSEEDEDGDEDEEDEDGEDEDEEEEDEEDEEEEEEDEEEEEEEEVVAPPKKNVRNANKIKEKEPVKPVRRGRPPKETIPVKTKAPAKAPVKQLSKVPVVSTRNVKKTGKGKK